MIVTASVMDPTVNGTYRHDRNARVTGDSLTFQRAVGSGISFLGTRVMAGWPFACRNRRLEFRK